MPSTIEVTKEEITDVLSDPLLGLDWRYPDYLYIIKGKIGNEVKHGVYSHKGIHGIASFEHPANAAMFSAKIELQGDVEIVSETFEKVRQLAKSKPDPINSVMILDRLDDPKIIYVK